MWDLIAGAAYLFAIVAVPCVFIWLHTLEGDAPLCATLKWPRRASAHCPGRASAGPLRYVLLPVLLLALPHVAFAQSLSLYGAGSLQVAMGAVLTAFSQTSGIAVTTEFGPSGLLRERIERGERPDLFASADLGHPARLVAQGLAGAPVVFVRNRLCVVGKPVARMRPDALLDLLLDPTLRVGTSTPKLDPSGDYTWVMFQRAETLRPGSFAALDRKALQVVGGPTNSQPVGGKGAVAVVFLRDAIDLYIGYCTSAQQTAKEVPGLTVVDIPDTLNVPAEYGLTILTGAKPQAADLVAFILSPRGQAILSSYGFAAVGGSGK